MNFIYTFVALILVSVLQAQRCDVIHGGVEQVDPQISTFSQPRHGNISIPVIFHIVYRNSDQNISDAQILAQLDILNSIYDPASIPNNTSIPEEFRNAIDIPKIHFCLAQEDPDGNYSNGIIRKQTTINNIGCRKQGAIYYIMSENLGGSEIWNPSHYLNIFIGEREDCPLAEAIFPDLATNKTDGMNFLLIIILAIIAILVALSAFAYAAQIVAAPFWVVGKVWKLVKMIIHNKK